MSKYIVWAKEPIGPQAKGFELQNWVIVIEADNLNEVFVEKVKAEEEYNRVVMTQEIEVKVELA